MVTFPFDNFIDDDVTDGDLLDNDIVTPIVGTVENDLIITDGGRNVIEDLGGNDWVIGGAGHNNFIDGEGNDVLIGLSGILDTVEKTGDYNYILSDNYLVAGDSSGNIEVNLLFGMEQAYLESTGVGDNTIDARDFSGFTSIILNGGNNTIFGGSASDNIQGSTGVDTIRGNDGDDNLLGRDGDDSLSGGAGEDIIDGGDDFDTLFESGDFDFDLTGNSLITTDHISGITETDTLFSIEHAFLEGGVSNNIINANALDPATGLQFTGTTTLHGNGGVDEIIGSEQDDIIVGGLGTDLLTSSSTLDQDVFHFNHALEGGDIISDFDSVGPLVSQDIIQVQASGFAAVGANSLTVGALPANQFVLGGADLGADAGFRYLGQTGELYFDHNGDTISTTGLDLSLVATFTNLPAGASLGDNIVVV